MSSADGTRRQRLRAATAPAHTKLDAGLEAAGCFDSEAGLVRYLQAVAPLYARLEARLDAAGIASWLPDWPQRRKAPLIAADLRALGADPAPLPGAATPCTTGAALGVLYVTEGATLGGAVLAPRLARLGLTRDRGASLFDPYGAARGARWRGYLAVLESLPLAPEQEAALVSAALATFALFSAALALPAPGPPLGSTGP